MMKDNLIPQCSPSTKNGKIKILLICTAITVFMLTLYNGNLSKAKTPAYQSNPSNFVFKFILGNKSQQVEIAGSRKIDNELPSIAQKFISKVADTLKDKVFKNPAISSHHKFDETLLENPYYKTFNVSNRKNKVRVNLLILISSAPERYPRRQNIRKTWWTQCNRRFEKTARCMFLTDNVSQNHKMYSQIQEEVSTNDDIVFQNVSGGVNFGVRMIYHMLYAQLNYNFDYFLRLDDDYFICLDELLYELPIPPLKEFHWGWVHHKGIEHKIRRAEQSAFMLSKDVVLTFLHQDSSLIMCHPWADLMVRQWVDDVNLRHIFRHDDRLYHDPPVAHNHHVRNEKNLCMKYIGLHGAYPKEMLHLWNNRGNAIPKKGNLFNNSVSVSINEKFCWRCAPSDWMYILKPCIENYQWDTRKQGNGPYIGRAGRI